MGTSLNVATLPSGVNAHSAYLGLFSQSPMLASLTRNRANVDRKTDASVVFQSESIVLIESGQGDADRCTCSWRD
jgi:hypothetical protein